MTRKKALNLLAKQGIEGEDAETALDKFMAWALNSHLEDARQLSEQEVMRFFGQDVGRLVLVLR